MEQPLPQCLSTNSVPRAFLPQVATGCRLSLQLCYYVMGGQHRWTFVFTGSLPLYLFVSV